MTVIYCHCLLMLEIVLFINEFLYRSKLDFTLIFTIVLTRIQYIHELLFKCHVDCHFLVEGFTH